MPLGLNLLLLGLDLDLLLGDGDLLGGRELLELLLLMDELVVLVGAGLGGHGVEDGGDGLALDDGLGDGSGRGDELSLKIQCECQPINLETCRFCLNCFTYRVGQVVVNLGWVDINFGYSTTCLILLGQLEVWQNGLWIWAG